MNGGTWHVMVPGDAGTSLRDRFSLNMVNAESEPGAGELQRGARTPASLVVARQHPSEVHFPNLFQFSPRLVSVFLPHPLSSPAQKGQLV